MPQSNWLQGMGALPQQLVIRILRASSIPALELIHLLPRTFHTAAVHTALPTIDADKSVRVEASYLEHASFAEALWPALSSVTSFWRLPLHYSEDNMSPETAAALGCQLAKLSCLQQLHLSVNRIAAGAAETLGPYLATLTSIQHLDLSHNRFEVDGAISLGPHLAHLTSIQQLNLCGNGIGAAGVESLVPRIQQLNLCGNSLRGNAGGVKLLGPVLADLTSIQQLNLGVNDIRDDGVESLGPYLAHLTSIQHLSLRCCQFGDSGINPLGPHLANLRSIQHLDLSAVMTLATMEPSI